MGPYGKRPAREELKNKGGRLDSLAFFTQPVTDVYVRYHQLRAWNRLYSETDTVLICDLIKVSLIVHACVYALNGF